MANLRQLTGTVLKPNGEVWAGLPFELWLVSDVAVQVGEVYPVRSVSFVTTSAGLIPTGVFLATPDAGAWTWTVAIGNNAQFEVMISGAGDLTIDELVALAQAQAVEAGAPQYVFWLGVWDGVVAAEAGEVLVADGAGGAEWQAPALRVRSVVTKVADYTATPADEVIRFTASATLTLPAATGSGKLFWVRALGAVTVVVEGNGSDTINEELTQTLGAGDSIQVIDEAAGVWGVY